MNVYIFFIIFYKNLSCRTYFIFPKHIVDVLITYDYFHFSEYALDVKGLYVLDFIFFSTFFSKETARFTFYYIWHALTLLWPFLALFRGLDTTQNAIRALILQVIKNYRLKICRSRYDALFIPYTYTCHLYKSYIAEVL